MASALDHRNGVNPTPAPTGQRVLNLNYVKARIEQTYTKEALARLEKRTLCVHVIDGISVTARLLASCLADTSTKEDAPCK